MGSFSHIFTGFGFLSKAAQKWHASVTILVLCAIALGLAIYALDPNHNEQIPTIIVFGAAHIMMINFIVMELLTFRYNMKNRSRGIEEYYIASFKHSAYEAGPSEKYIWCQSVNIFFMLLFSFVIGTFWHVSVG